MEPAERAAAPQHAVSAPHALVLPRGDAGLPHAAAGRGGPRPRTGRPQEVQDGRHERGRRADHVAALRFEKAGTSVKQKQHESDMISDSDWSVFREL